MIKTIKVKKKLRLDELIKYIFDNDVKSKEFFIHGEGEVENPRNLTVDYQGMVRFYFGIYSVDTFTVEVEEEITEDTEFEAFVVITDKGTIKSINNHHNMRAVRELLENYVVEQKIYALIDNNLQLIWEAK